MPTTFGANRASMMAALMPVPKPGTVTPSGSVKTTFQTEASVRMEAGKSCRILPCAVTDLGMSQPSAPPRRLRKPAQDARPRGNSAGLL